MATKFTFLRRLSLQNFSPRPIVLGPTYSRPIPYASAFHTTRTLRDSSSSPGDHSKLMQQLSENPKIAQDMMELYQVLLKNGIDPSKGRPKMTSIFKMLANREIAEKLNNMMQSMKNVGIQFDVGNMKEMQQIMEQQMKLEMEEENKNKQ